MKVALISLMLPIAILSCEQHPLENLRKAHTMEELKRFKKEGEVTMGMYNHVIAYDDVELLQLFFSQRSGRNTEIVYEDLQLSQADRRGAEPIYFYPLHLAAQFGARNVASFCIDNKADINSRTESKIAEYHNNTPAHIATLFGRHEILLLLLTSGPRLTRGAILDLKNGTNKTIEDIARDKGDEAAISMITVIRKERERIAQEKSDQKP
jgi:hypothetical protein